MRSSLLSISLFTTILFSLAGCGGGSSTEGSGGSAGSAGAAGSAGMGGSGGTGGSAGMGGSGGTGGSAGMGGSAGTGGAGGAPVIGGDRPVTMYIPDGYDPKTPAPLLVLLHGYGASGMVQEIYFGLKDLANQKGFIYAVPDGTVDSSMKKFWNATDACCDFGSTGVDDSAYLSGVIDEIKAAYSVDPKRVFFVGHSNGSFMSYRMACDHADKIAAIVGLAGATYADDTKCKPSEPVAVAHIHGTMDETVGYDGLMMGGITIVPSAVKTAETWAAHDGCGLTPTDGGTKDLEGKLAGAETKVTVYGDGCKAGGHVELWTIEGGTHIPGLTADFRKAVFDFIEAHPKP